MIDKTFHFVEEYVSCIHCACCYGKEEKPTWCQVFSFPVDLDNIDENQKMAQKCDNWIPKGMRRDLTKTPDVERWYEKDSMG